MACAHACACADGLFTAPAARAPAEANVDGTVFSSGAWYVGYVPGYILSYILGYILGYGVLVSTGA